jgi:hypothetical protein
MQVVKEIRSGMKARGACLRGFPLVNAAGCDTVGPVNSEEHRGAV